MTSFGCSTNVVGDHARIVFTGELLSATRAVLAAQLDLALGARVSTIVLDLANCTSIDSAGMGSLVTAAKRAREKGCRIQLDGFDPDLRETLRETKLDTLFDWPAAATPGGKRLDRCGFKPAVVAHG